MEVSGVEKIYKDLKARVKVTMPLEKKFYGVTEFAFEIRKGTWFLSLSARLKNRS